MGALTPQLTTEVEVLTHVDSGEASIGKKINELESLFPRVEQEDRD
jgi:hypothetical protein